MIARLFHRWERQLASETRDRVVRPFEWGLDWIPVNGEAAKSPSAAIHRWVREVMEDTEGFFETPPTSATSAYRMNGDVLTFPSAYVTPHAENNVAYARYFPASVRSRKGPRRAVIVLPQWNADHTGHVALSRLFARLGISALRLSLPYHDCRMPPELHRADYIVSSNVVRTVQVCRQAVMDARRAIAWLAREGYDRIGVLGTSLGSCLALLTTAHEPLVRAAALNHISPYFADVVWDGLSTRHVRAGLEGSIDLDTLRSLWRPINPFSYLDRVRGRRLLLVYAKYDLTFPVALSEGLVRELEARGIDHDLAVLPCGHYSTGLFPFNWLDGFVLGRFLRRAL